jgi:hypothetical protein
MEYGTKEWFNHAMKTQGEGYKKLHLEKQNAMDKDKENTMNKYHKHMIKIIIGGLICFGMTIFIVTQLGNFIVESIENVVNGNNCSE